MKPIDEIITTYFRAWNDPTLEGCTALLRESCADDVAYVDPKYTRRGITELAARILGSRKQVPNARVELTSAIDGYDDTFRYAWVFFTTDERIRVPGIDVVVRGSDGRIATITSFFGALETIPAGAATRVQARWGA
jgi:hypothetical protein